jgi:hypothetical protein
MVIVGLILILLALIPCGRALPIHLPHSDHLDHVHGTLSDCIQTKLESCVERKKVLRRRRIEQDRCIYLSLVNCFAKAVPDDPLYSSLKRCFHLCRRKEPEHVHAICLLECVIITCIQGKSTKLAFKSIYIN